MEELYQFFIWNANLFAKKIKKNHTFLSNYLKKPEKQVKNRDRPQSAAVKGGGNKRQLIHFPETTNTVGIDKRQKIPLRGIIMIRIRTSMTITEY